MSKTRDVFLRFPPEVLAELDKELRRKFAPFEPPSRNSVFLLAIREYIIRLRAENDEAGR